MKNTVRVLLVLSSMAAYCSESQGGQSIFDPAKMAAGKKELSAAMKKSAGRPFSEAEKREHRKRDRLAKIIAKESKEKRDKAVDAQRQQVAALPNSVPSDTSRTLDFK